jgi:hypothetical protein
MISTVEAVRYITPFREGSSVPALVEASDTQLYVMKFVGSGHGRKALIAELVAGEIARALGLPIPELAFIDLDPVLGRSEPHPEIQAILTASSGINLGLRYLPNAMTFNLLLAPPPDVELASQIVWFDALVTNVDRTPKNVNMLISKGQLWLIDHGSSLYFHHNWPGYLANSKTRFPYIKQHALLPLAGELHQVDHILRARLTPALIREIVGLIPNTWLDGENVFPTFDAHREAYVAYLTSRLDASQIWVEEAVGARAACI